MGFGVLQGDQGCISLGRTDASYKTMECGTEYPDSGQVLLGQQPTAAQQDGGPQADRDAYQFGVPGYSLLVYPRGGLKINRNCEGVCD